MDHFAEAGRPAFWVFQVGIPLLVGVLANLLTLWFLDYLRRSVLTRLSTGASKWWLVRETRMLLRDLRHLLRDLRHAPRSERLFTVRVVFAIPVGCALGIGVVLASPAPELLLYRVLGALIVGVSFGFWLGLYACLFPATTVLVAALLFMSDSESAWSAATKVLVLTPFLVLTIEVIRVGLIRHFRELLTKRRQQQPIVRRTELERRLAGRQG